MHAVRIAYFVRGKNGKKEIVKEAAFLPSGGCPITGAGAKAVNEVVPPVWFEWMFKKRKGFPPNLKKPEILAGLLKVAYSLIDLGECMDSPAEFFKEEKNKPFAPD